MAILQKVCEGFISLKGSPYELWIAYLLKFLDSYSYYSLSLMMTLFLSKDFGFDDYWAGTIYGAWGALITLFGLLTGSVIDKLGVAASLKWGFVLSLISKCIIFITTSKAYLLFGITLMSLGNCLGIPVLTVGIRRYTTEENRGFAFGLFYVIMNFAALLSGPTVDFCTIVFQNQKDTTAEMGRRKLEDSNANEMINNYTGEGIHWTLSGYRLVILIGIITNIAACLVTLTVKEIKVTSSKVAIEEHENCSITTNSTTSTSNQTQSFQPVKGSALQILKETIYSPDFWRFLAVCMITLNIRMIFRHLDATLPKYMVREFGPNVAKGTIYSINPLLIMILVPIITAATTKVPPLIMIHHGCYISAISVFFLVISTSITSCIFFVIVLSIGEAIWSPRLYDYTMEIAKEGREGTYMALSSAPLFLAKLPVGMMSGYLLQKYCPEEGERNSPMMWLIIGLTTVSSPILLTVFWGYISNYKSSDDQIINTEDGIVYDEAKPFNETEMASVVVLRRKKSFCSS